jgi:hypothetical protein
VSTGFCDNHSFEVSEDDCRTCGRSFCTECLLYAWGPKRPPLCKSCAIAVAGIRKNGGRTPVASRRELKRQQRERRRMRRSKPEATPAPALPNAGDWDAIEHGDDQHQTVEPVHEEEHAYVGAGGGVGAGVAAGLGFGIDEQELREVRPSYDAQR